MNGELTRTAVFAAQFRPIVTEAALALAAEVHAAVRAGNDSALQSSRYALLASALGDLASACERVIHEVRREVALENVQGASE